ncbi:MAG: hypothetical protein H7Y33_15930 [Cytophagales bacterium]|nr:hypothetical protein [Rhizobacter sp.]
MSDISAVRPPMCLPSDYPECRADDPLEAPVDESPAAQVVGFADAERAPELALVSPPPEAVLLLAEKAVQTMLGGAPEAVAGRGLLALGGTVGMVAIGLVLGFPSKAGDGLASAEGDGPTPPSRIVDGHSSADTAAEVQPEPKPEPEPEAAPAAAAPPVGDGGVPPAPSRATQFLNGDRADPEIASQVAKIQAARTASDPATRQALLDALRQQEVNGLHERIETLKENIVKTANPEQRVLIDELVRSFNRLIELGAPYQETVE